MALTYKFVELSIVSDDTIETCVNQWVHAGWTFEGIRFVTSDASRRPVMAFVSFVRHDGATLVDGSADERDVVQSESPVQRIGNPLAALIDRK